MWTDLSTIITARRLFRGMDIEDLLNVENPRDPQEQVEAVEGPEDEISYTEIEKANANKCVITKHQDHLVLLQK